MIIELIRQDIESNKFIPASKFDFGKVKSKVKSYANYEDKIAFLMEARTSTFKTNQK